jgi:hypothetical protein
LYSFEHISRETYSSIAVPEVQIDTGDRLTGGAIDHLDVHIERDTCLVIGDIAADQFAAYICRSSVDS